ncbi:hypothetical protein Fcan01_28361 [Folsomia candida]|uniref:Uncharacterized protein n=1 Tax=Folsomia candida TaxID=158441 RepID=A0A226CWL5_FOLCA|nr:hypothetical protein Fcan01_28361 [Folsomia candida]
MCFVLFFKNLASPSPTPVVIKSGRRGRPPKRKLSDGDTPLEQSAPKKGKTTKPSPSVANDDGTIDPVPEKPGRGRPKNKDTNNKDVTTSKSVSPSASHKKKSTTKTVLLPDSSSPSPKKGASEGEKGRKSECDHLEVKTGPSSGGSSSSGKSLLMDQDYGNIVAEGGERAGGCGAKSAKEFVSTAEKNQVERECDKFSERVNPHGSQEQEEKCAHQRTFPITT